MATKKVDVASPINARAVQSLVVEDVSVAELTTYERNSRTHSESQVRQLARSIAEFGFTNPVLVDEANVLIAGHGRLEASRLLGLERVPAIRLVGLSDDQKKALRIADNKLAMNAGWDEDLLKLELGELNLAGFDLDLVGFSDDELKDIIDPDWVKQEAQTGTLVERYVVPPFSILDARQGYWKERKKEWQSLIVSEVGRDEGLLGNGLKALAQNNGKNLNGTSVFDPVLAEVLVHWFTPQGGSIIDPFAGGSVRGLVASMLGRDYTGVDIRQKQIDANNDNYNAINGAKDFSGGDLRKPNWICGDSANIDSLAGGKYDALLTCPPYADLEVYSDDPRDISNMSYDDFKEAYFDIIKKSVSLLKDNAFASIVVGDVRDKKGVYRNFIGDTIKAFTDAGMRYYNEIIFIESGAIACLRADRQFRSGRKVVKIHQNVLVFVKGDHKKIKLNEYKFDESILEE
jgi:DNA modification methylase